MQNQSKYYRKMVKEKLIFMGTSEISVICLQEFIKQDFFEILHIVSKKNSALSKFAQKNGLNVQDNLQNLSKVDKIAVVDFGVIIPDEILNLASHGAYNLHFSLLPKYRGASPVQSAILAGEKVSGVSIIAVTKELDAGDVYAQEKVDIAGLRADEVFQKMLAVGAPLFAQTVANPLAPQAQDENQATFCGKIKKEDGQIIPAEISCSELVCKVNAFYPWPSVYFQHEKLGFLKILRARESQERGEGLFKANKCLFLAAKDGVVEVLEIQREGKKALSGEEFARGWQIPTP